MANRIMQLLLEDVEALYVCHIHAWNLSLAVLSCFTLQQMRGLSILTIALRETPSNLHITALRLAQEYAALRG